MFLDFRAHIGRKAGETGRVLGGPKRLGFGCGTIRLSRLRGPASKPVPVVFKRGLMAGIGVHCDPFELCRSSGHFCEVL